MDVVVVDDDDDDDDDDAVVIVAVGEVAVVVLVDDDSVESDDIAVPSINCVWASFEFNIIVCEFFCCWWTLIVDKSSGQGKSSCMIEWWTISECKLENSLVKPWWTMEKQKWKERQETIS